MTEIKRRFGSVASRGTTWHTMRETSRRALSNCYDRPVRGTMCIAWRESHASLLFVGSVCVVGCGDGHHILDAAQSLPVRKRPVHIASDQR